MGQSPNKGLGSPYKGPKLQTRAGTGHARGDIPPIRAGMPILGAKYATRARRLCMGNQRVKDPK